MSERMGLPAESLKPCRPRRVKSVSRGVNLDVKTWSSNLERGGGMMGQKPYSVKHYCFRSPVGGDCGLETGRSALGRQRIKIFTFSVITGCSNLLCTIPSATHIPHWKIYNSSSTCRRPIELVVVVYNYSTPWWLENNAPSYRRGWEWVQLYLYSPLWALGGLL
jgi:hypothetical protein